MGKHKVLKWTILIVSLILVLVLLISIDNWAADWKNLFFYIDDWTSWIFVGLLVMSVTGIIRLLFHYENKLLK